MWASFVANRPSGIGLLDSLGKYFSFDLIVKFYIWFRKFSIQGEVDGAAFAVVNQVWAWLFQKQKQKF
jgi:hypothetical protein